MNSTSTPFTPLIQGAISVIIILGFLVLILICFSQLKIWERIPDLCPGKSAINSPTGLKNISSICYMNSMIQAVAASDILIEECKNISDSKKTCKSLKLFLNLLHGVNKPGNEKKVRNENTEIMKELIKTIGWNKPSQQDAYDLFASLIKSIHDELKKSNETDKLICKPEIQLPIKIKLVNVFSGMDIKPKVQDYLGLSIGLCGEYSCKPGVSIEYLIQQHFSPTTIDDNPDKTTQVYFYLRAPDILMLHIQANKWNDERQEMVKPEYYIKYKKKMILNLKIYKENLEEKTRESQFTYTLKAVVRHMGTISGGHYVTYRDYHGTWFLISDEQVEEFDMIEMKRWSKDDVEMIGDYYNEVDFDVSIVPYIMIYEKEKDKKNFTTWF